jgi:stage V sporulation protein B
MRYSPAEGTLKKLVSGTAVLSAAAAVTKIVGMFYKIPLIKYVGIEGMAYFLAANHIYIFLFVISTSGLPTAVSIMVSEASAKNDGGFNGINAVFRAALFMFLFIGAAGTLFMLAASGSIARLINIEGAGRCICAIAPAVIMSCISGAYRGYFQGRQIMKHTAVSQMIEAFGKLLLGLAGAMYSLRLGYDSETVAAFAIAGITAGVGISMLYLAAAKAAYDRKIKKKLKVDNKNTAAVRRDIIAADNKTKNKAMMEIAARLFRIALPITLSSAVISLTGLIDTSLIANCLAFAGFSTSAINRLYSCYGNIAVPLFSLTPALIAPVSVTSVPLISAALKNGNHLEAGRIADSAFRLTLLAALPASAGLSVFAEQIIRLIFPDEAEAVGIAAPLLSLLALSVVTACLITTTNAALQAGGRAGRTIVSMLAGAGVKIISEILLISNPNVNIYGAPVSTFICNLTIVIINIYFISKFMPSAADFGKAFIPTAASSAAAVCGASLIFKLSADMIAGTFSIIPAIAGAAAIYLIMIFFTGAATQELIEMLPGGKTIALKLYKTKKSTKQEP